LDSFDISKVPDDIRQEAERRVAEMMAAESPKEDADYDEFLGTCIYQYIYIYIYIYFATLITLTSTSPKKPQYIDKNKQRSSSPISREARTIGRSIPSLPMPVPWTTPKTTWTCRP